MSSARWGKTIGAYKRYEHIFTKKLPVTVPCSAPISTAAYLRDIIKFAYKNGLTGSAWCGKVMVSPQEDGTVIIKARPLYAEELGETILPTVHITDLIPMLGGKEIKVGYQCTLAQDFEQISDLVKGFGFKLHKLGGKDVEFRSAD